MGLSDEFIPTPEVTGSWKSPRIPASVLAVDGGQSAIRVRHSHGTGDGEVSGISRLEGNVISAVARAIVEGWKQTGRRPVDRLVMGLTTAPVERYEQGELCSLAGRSVKSHDVWLMDDAVITHAGGLSLGWGVSLTVGTGVACLALPEDPADHPQLVSGHGFLLGDEGGAYWIGREGLRAAMRRWDGRGPATELVEAAEATFGRMNGMSGRLHAQPRPVNDIAHFAPRVLALAEAGDEQAERIVREAATELTSVIRAGVRAAAATQPAGAGSVPVALGGRLLSPGTILRRWLEKSVAAELPAAATRDADGTPLDGAMMLGQQRAPGRYAELVTRWVDDL